MPLATEKPGSQTRSILSSTGNRVRFLEEQRKKQHMTKKKPSDKAKKVISPSPNKPVATATVLRYNISAHSSSDSSSSSSYDSSSSSNGSNVKTSKNVSSKDVARKVDALNLSSPAVPVPVKRCDWITPNSEPLYTSFHDEEWGVPVNDDIKLFELLVLSQALGELSWPVILSKRTIFRKLFDDFDPTSVANVDEERLLSMKVHGSTLLSEPKLRAIVDNAKHLVKIQQEFGSISNYFWHFVNHKPIQSGFRYARKVPAKTPKSELISKDMMRRGFRFVGPTVVYSFMQVAGIVNDHLVTCFRYNECSHAAAKDTSPDPAEIEVSDEEATKKATGTSEP